MNFISSDNFKDKEFYNRLKDLCEDCLENQRVRILPFLDERQQFIASKFKFDNLLCKSFFYGGYNSAVRKMLVVAPLYFSLEITEDSILSKIDIPIESITFMYKEDTLTHRDFLGSLMALNIKREMIGDILIEKSRAVVFCHSNVLKIILDEIRKIGRTGVKVFKGYEEPLPESDKKEEIKINISSKRLDCFVASLANTSREKALSLIQSDAVVVNYQTINKPTLNINQGDIITITGKGKFKVKEYLGNTKKDRLIVIVSKYI